MTIKNKEQMTKERMLDLALAQFTGFHLGKWGGYKRTC